MVKGISRQVIVVNSPDPKLFEQAIFIVRNGQKEITDDLLLKEAKQLMNMHCVSKCNRNILPGVFCAACGAMLTGVFWLLSVIL